MERVENAVGGRRRGDRQRVNPPRSRGDRYGSVSVAGGPDLGIKGGQITVAKSIVSINDYSVRARAKLPDRGSLREDPHDDAGRRPATTESGGRGHSCACVQGEHPAPSRVGRLELRVMPARLEHHGTLSFSEQSRRIGLLRVKSPLGSLASACVDVDCQGRREAPWESMHR